MERLYGAIQVTDVHTGKSYIRHGECVGAGEVVGSTHILFPASRSKPYTCGDCGKKIPLRQPQNPNRERGAFRGIFDKDD